MTFKFDISAGEFFDMVRPAVLVLSALVSIWVLASARRRRFPVYVTIGWALGTLFFPLIIFPLYLIARFIRRKNDQSTGDGAQKTVPFSHAPRWRFGIPLAYAAVVLSSIGIYLYREQRSVDAYLARAAQARVSGKRGGTIEEYRAALRLEDNPHTRKLLAIELADTGDWTGGLIELRQAEEDGEKDDQIPYFIAKLLDRLNLPNQATLEYQRFVESGLCTQTNPDERCEGARLRVETARIEMQPK